MVEQEISEFASSCFPTSIQLPTAKLAAAGMLPTLPSAAIDRRDVTRYLQILSFLNNSLTSSQVRSRIQQPRQCKTTRRQQPARAKTNVWSAAHCLSEHQNCRYTRAVRYQCACSMGPKNAQIKSAMSDGISSI